MFTKPVKTVSNISHDCRAIAKPNGKTIFIHGGLPDETLEIKPIRNFKKYGNAICTKVIVASPNRITAKCPHFGICGGCVAQTMSDELQINLKQQIVEEKLKHFANLTVQNWLPALAADTWNYRIKTRLSVKFVTKKNALLIGFRELHNSNFVANIDVCHILALDIANLIPKIKLILEKLSIMKHIPQLDITAGDNKVGVIIRNLQEPTPKDIELLINFSTQNKVILFLQPGNDQSVTPLNHNNELLSYSLPKQNLIFRFHPQDFVQNNQSINRILIEQMLHLLQLSANSTVLDLFCGIGNLTLPLAKHAKQVTGIELSEKMVTRAEYNAKENNIRNCNFISINLIKSNINELFKPNEFTHIVIDPPRSGAFEIMPALRKLAPRKIIYVSCDSSTFSRDAKELTKDGNYKLASIGLANMFPHTKHIELISLFVRNHD